jgi:3-hydroxyisobutyrate dehydrogenase-like beta-hydroxyacid dehydrogenase
MNAKNLLPLTAAAVFALCAGSMVISATHADNNRNAASADRIVTLPTVSVTPDAADLAHYNTYKDTKIVDLATITVTPSAQDLAYYVANQAVRIVDMPVVTVRPSADDMQQIAVQAGVLAGQLASR